MMHVLKCPFYHQFSQGYKKVNNQTSQQPLPTGSYVNVLDSLQTLRTGIRGVTGWGDAQSGKHLSRKHMDQSQVPELEFLIIPQRLTSGCHMWHVHKHTQTACRMSVVTSIQK